MVEEELQFGFPEVRNWNRANGSLVSVVGGKYFHSGEWVVNWQCSGVGWVLSLGSPFFMQQSASKNMKKVMTASRGGFLDSLNAP